MTKTNKQHKVGNIEFSVATLENMEECGVTEEDVKVDIARLMAGERTKSSLLFECLNGAERSREAGWREYVDSLAAYCDSKGAVVS